MKVAIDNIKYAINKEDSSKIYYAINTISSHFNNQLEVVTTPLIGVCPHSHQAKDFFTPIREKDSKIMLY
jgi:hypothetical protein